MANMPPRRFNYQQRVGRAGRRGTGVSLAVTFCRGRSHDDYYYLRPELMTGDPPSHPYVDMDRVPIFRRVLVKEVLRQAFEALSPDVRERWYLNKQSIGIAKVSTESLDLLQDGQSRVHIFKVGLMTY